MDAHALLLFLGLDLLLVLTPGPDWLYVVARGLGQGNRAGLTAVAGICTGYGVHTVLVAAGLATVLAAVPGALPVLRYAGAVYLVILAVRMLRTLRRDAPVAAAADPLAPHVVFRQSLLTALLNPKGLLLFLSLMPQFTEPDAALGMGTQVVLLGTLHVLSCGLVYSAVAVTTGRVRQALAWTPRATRRLESVAAALLLVVAAVTVSTS